MAKRSRRRSKQLVRNKKLLRSKTRRSKKLRRSKKSGRKIHFKKRTRRKIHKRRQRGGNVINMLYKRKQYYERYGDLWGDGDISRKIDEIDDKSNTSINRSDLINLYSLGNWWPFTNKIDFDTECDHLDIFVNNIKKGRPYATVMEEEFKNRWKSIGKRTAVPENLRDKLYL